MFLTAQRNDPARRNEIVTRISAIHAASWKSAYRGILADNYLDHEVEADRLAHWQQRVPQLEAGVGEIFLATMASRPSGFVCIEIGPDSEWGALVDNLHVLPRYRGENIGGLLLAAAEDWARRHRQIQLHLWVFEENHSARRFYRREGWHEAERQSEEIPGGGERIVWRLIKRL